MTELSVFECNGCGDRHGHVTEMNTVSVRYPSGEYDTPREDTIHVCLTCGPDGLHGILSSIESVFVERGSAARYRVVAVVLNGGERLPREKVSKIETMAAGEAVALEWLEGHAL